ncbi:hypothetical protein U1Q18_036653, partial [Sarracenia purpurea var. burkii]
MASAAGANGAAICYLTEPIELSLDLPLSEPRSPQDLRPRFVTSASWEKNPAAQEQSSA